MPAWVSGTSVAATGTITFLGQQLAALHPIVDTWNVGSPLAIDYESLAKQRRRYRLAGSLGAESMYPIVLGYKDTTAVGMRVNFSDPVQLNRASVTASYTPDQRLAPNERLHLDADYERYDWRVRASLNQASFYDLFGPTKTARKGYAVGIGRTQTIVFDEPRRLTLDVDADLFGDLNRLPEYQHVAVDIRRLAVFEANLAFTDIRNSLGSVDEESGTKWSVKGQGRYVDGAFITQIRGDFAGGIALGRNIHRSGSVSGRDSLPQSARCRSRTFIWVGLAITTSMPVTKSDTARRWRSQGPLSTASQGAISSSRWWS